MRIIVGFAWLGAALMLWARGPLPRRPGSEILQSRARQQADQPARNPYAGNDAARRAGAKLYAQHCAACHEAGGRAPSLRSATIKALPDEALFQILKNGIMRRGMPSWAHLPEAQRWQIIEYLRQVPSPPGTGPP